MEFRVLDLFCGAGGFSCGLDSLPGFKTVIGVDFDGNVLETFEKNIKGSITIKGDFKPVTFKVIPETVKFITRNAPALRTWIIY